MNKLLMLVWLLAIAGCAHAPSGSTCKLTTVEQQNLENDVIAMQSEVATMRRLVESTESHLSAGERERCRATREKVYPAELRVHDLNLMKAALNSQRKALQVELQKAKEIIFGPY